MIIYVLFVVSGRTNRSIVVVFFSGKAVHSLLFFHSCSHHYIFIFGTLRKNIVFRMSDFICTSDQSELRYSISAPIKKNNFIKLVVIDLIVSKYENVVFNCSYASKNLDANKPYIRKLFRNFIEYSLSYMWKVYFANRKCTFQIYYPSA